MAENERTWADGKMLSEQQGAVGVITFNHPERLNAVTMEMWQALEHKAAQSGEINR